MADKTVTEIRNELFTALDNGAKWDVGVSINRTNPLPLDANSLFRSVADAETYASTNVLAYVGQYLTVFTEDSVETPSVVEAYVIGPNKQLQKLATTTATGDLAADILDLQGRVENLEGRMNAVEAELPKKQDTLTAGEAIEITSAGDVNTIDVKLDNTTGGNILTINEGKGLYATVDVPEYTLAVSATSEGAAKSYELQKDGVQVGVKIDIPKDLVVTSGTLVGPIAKPDDYVGDDWDAEARYIRLAINSSNIDTDTEPNNVIYINVKDLLDDKPFDIESGSTPPNTETSDKYSTESDNILKLVVTSDNSTGTKIYTLTPKIIKNSITANEIKDKTITKDKLDDSVQASLGKADGAVQNVTLEKGTENGTLKLTVDSKEAQVVQVTGINNAAYKDVSTLLSSASTDNELVTAKTVYAALQVRRVTA